MEGAATTIMTWELFSAVVNEAFLSFLALCYLLAFDVKNKYLEKQTAPKKAGKGSSRMEEPTDLKEVESRVEDEKAYSQQTREERKQKKKSRRRREMERLASGLDGVKWQQIESFDQRDGGNTEALIDVSATLEGKFDLANVSLSTMQSIFQTSSKEKGELPGTEEREGAKEKGATETLAPRNGRKKNTNVSDNSLDGDYWKPNYQLGKRPSRLRGEDSILASLAQSWDVAVASDSGEELYSDDEVFVDDACSEDDEQEVDEEDLDEEITTKRATPNEKRPYGMFNMFTEEAIKGWSQGKIAAWMNKRVNPNGFYYRFLGRSPHLRT